MFKDFGQSRMISESGWLVLILLAVFSVLVILDVQDCLSHAPWSVMEIYNVPNDM